MYATVLCFVSLLALVTASDSVIDNNVSKTSEFKTESVVWRAGDTSGTAVRSASGDASALLDTNDISDRVQWSSRSKSGDVKGKESGDVSATWTILSNPGKVTGSVEEKKSTNVDPSGIKTGDKSGTVSWGGGSHSGNTKWQGRGSSNVTGEGKGSGSGEWSKDGGSVQWNGGFVRWGQNGASESWHGKHRGNGNITQVFSKWGRDGTGFSKWGKKGNDVKKSGS